MKKTVSFSKSITFKTIIAEITDISVSHTLKLNNDNEISGDILVDGKYRMTEASNLEEEFHYKLPFIIAIDNKYEVVDLDINIDNFNFEIINEEELKIDVLIGIDGIYEKELVREDLEIPVEIEEKIEKVNLSEDDLPIEKLEEELKKNNEKEESKNLGSIFSSLDNTNETYSTYSVYIVRDVDNIEEILNKYNISREELSNYNDLENIKTGTKLIIPCHNE